MNAFLKRVVLKDYKSIAACDIALGPLTFLVGPNGAGKSSFLDALRFVSDGLRNSLDHALRDRGGIKEVRRRSGGHPRHFGVRLEFSLPNGAAGHYSFRIGAAHSAGFEVQQEECVLLHPGFPSSKDFFRVRSGMVESSVPTAPVATPDRLYLVNAAGLPVFRPLYDALSRMGFYNLNPDRIRDLQPPDPGDLLARDGSNMASVLSVLGKEKPALKVRIEEYLAKVVPGIRGVTAASIGPKETLEFRQDVKGARDPWTFYASNMSDGTLRALGVLVCLFQGRNGSSPRTLLVGIEEPETALHPAAAGVVLESLREASGHVQILVTSHSPDLLDDPKIDTEALLAVEMADGATRIGRLDPGSRSALKERLYTPGELMRMNQLAPDPESIPEPEGKQLRLFDQPDER